MQPEGRKGNADPPPLRLRLPNLGGRQEKTDLKIAAPSDPDIEFLVTDEGEPVWPVTSLAEMEILRDAAKLFGGRLVEVSATPGTIETAKDEVVAGLDGGGDEAALYAHLTGRRSREVENVEELSFIRDLAVVLTCGPELDRNLLQWASLLQYGRQAPGIIWGRNSAELHMQVLTSSCAATLNGPPATAYFGVGHSYSAGIGSIVKGVGAGAGVLHLAGHGDGVSQELGANGALCRRPQLSSDNAERGPECVYTGYCKVIKMPVNEALAAGALVPPTAFAGRILVNSTCHGISSGRGIADPQWATFPALVSNPRIGAIIAVPELSIYLGGPIEDELITALQSGEAAGEALARFEENPTVQELGYHFLLFGDPAVRAAPPGGGVKMIMRDGASRQKGATSPPGEMGVSIPGLDMLRQIAMDVKTETREEGKRTSQALLSGIAELEDSTNREKAIHGEIGKAIRNGAIEHLGTTKVRLFEAWSRFAIVRKSEELVTCPYCGWRNHSKIVTLTAGEQRQFRMCPYCSDVEDAPLSQTGCFSIDLPHITRQPIANSEAWAAAVYVVRSLPAQTELLPWPVDDQGAPALSFDLPHLDVQRGPVRIYAVSIEGLNIFSATAPVTPN